MPSGGRFPRGPRWGAETSLTTGARRRSPPPPAHRAAGVNGQHHFKKRALIPAGANLNFASQRSDSLLHSKQSKGAAGRNASGGNTHAIIFHEQANRVSAAFQANREVSRLRMFGNVMQRFLQRAIDSNLEFAIEWAEVASEGPNVPSFPCACSAHGLPCVPQPASPTPQACEATSG